MLTLIAAVAALAAGSPLFGPARAPAAAEREPIAVVANDGTFSFAERLAFRLEVTADSPIEEVVLRFTISDGEVINRRIPEFTGGTQVVARHEEPTPRGAIPPTSEIKWWWDVTCADGSHVQTPARTLRYLDQRYAWVSRDVEGVRLWSYSLKDAEADDLAAAAVASLAEVKRRAGLAVERTVNVVAYASQTDLRPAMLGRGDTYESRLATLGARVADDVVLIDAGSRSVALDTVLRHELTHVAVHLHMKEPWIDVPSWLDEGLAMYMEGEVESTEQRALDKAVRDDALMSIRSMTSFPGDASQITLAYAESRDIIAYLVDTYGSARLTALFDALAEGDATIDDAATAVYGLDQLGLYQAYRRARGLPPAATPPPGAVPPGLAEAAAERGRREPDGVGGGDGGTPVPSAIARRARRLVLPVAAALAGLIGLAALLVLTKGGRPRLAHPTASGPMAADPGAPEPLPGGFPIAALPGVPPAAPLAAPFPNPPDVPPVAPPAAPSSVDDDAAGTTAPPWSPS